jgi:hypothetical protein
MFRCDRAISGMPSPMKTRNTLRKSSSIAYASRKETMARVFPLELRARRRLSS